MVGKLSKQIDYKVNINNQILTVLNLKITINFDKNIHSTFESSRGKKRILNNAWKFQGSNPFFSLPECHPTALCYWVLPAVIHWKYVFMKASYNSLL